jgi:hypothetical protein
MHVFKGIHSRLKKSFSCYKGISKYSDKKFVNLNKKLSKENIEKIYEEELKRRAILAKEIVVPKVRKTVKRSSIYYQVIAKHKFDN